MWYNAIISWLLKSPLHPLLSKNMMLVSVTGRKSGRRYTTPTSYLRHSGALWVVSVRHRTWWRNLRGGAPVTVRLQGRELPGTGTVVEDDETVTANLLAYLQYAPQLARYLGVALDDGGRPNPAGVARAAKDKVMIQILLTDTL